MSISPATLLSKTIDGSRARLYFSLLMSGIYALAYTLSQSPDPAIVPDSPSYIENTAIRTSLYPAFLYLVDVVGLSVSAVPTIQFCIFLISFAILCYVALRHGVSAPTVVIFTSALAFNVYFNGFHNHILTESLSFSITLLLMAGLLAYANLRNTVAVVAMTAAVGMLVGLRPSAWALVPVLLIGICMLNWGNAARLRKHILFCCVVLIGLVWVENALFYANNSQRDSILPRHLFAKMTMLTTLPQFSSKDFPPELQQFVAEIDAAFAPAETYLASIDSFMLRPALTGDIEVYAQWRFFGKEIERKAQQLGMSPQELRRSLGVHAIKRYWPQYLEISGIYYLGLWIVGPETTFAASRPPNRQIFPDLDQNSASKAGSRWLHVAALPAFLILGLLNACIFICGLVTLIPQLRRFQALDYSNQTLSAIILVFFVQASLVLIALANISTLRYLMAVYPMAAMSVLLVSQELLPSAIVGKVEFRRAA